MNPQPEADKGKKSTRRGEPRSWNLTAKRKGVPKQKESKGFYTSLKKWGFSAAWQREVVTREVTLPQGRGKERRQDAKTAPKRRTAEEKGDRGPSTETVPSAARDGCC